MYIKYKTLDSIKISELQLEEMKMQFVNENKELDYDYGFFNNEQCLKELDFEMFFSKLYEVKDPKDRYRTVYNCEELDIYRESVLFSFGQKGHLYLKKKARDALWTAIEEAVISTVSIFDMDAWYDKYCEENEVTE